MNETKLANFLNYISFAKFEYSSIYPTIASVMDHYLFCIGNGYRYNPETGIVDAYEGTSLFSDFEITPEKIQEEHQNDIAYHEQVTKEWTEIFGLSEELSDKMKKRLEYHEKVYSFIDAEVLFNSEAVAKEYTDYITSESYKETYGKRHHCGLYPMSEGYSIIYDIVNDENADLILVAFALTACKAWKLILEFQLEHELYNETKTTEYVDYNTKEYNQQYITELSTIIQKLESK